MGTRWWKDLVKRALWRRGYDIVRLGESYGQSLNLLEWGIRDHLAREPRDDFRFVQIGAGDGVDSDGLHPLIERFSLPGVLVEPRPEAFAALQRTYAGQRHLILERCAIAAADGVRTLYQFRAHPAVPDWAYGMASFNKAHLTKFSATARLGRHIEAMPVPTMTFASLLRKHHIDRISLLQVDTEGYDYEILKMVFAAGVFPALINYEHEHLSGFDHLACKRQLASYGYQFVQYGRDILAMRIDRVPAVQAHTVTAADP